MQVSGSSWVATEFSCSGCLISIKFCRSTMTFKFLDNLIEYRKAWLETGKSPHIIYLLSFVFLLGQAYSFASSAKQKDCIVLFSKSVQHRSCSSSPKALKCYSSLLLTDVSYKTNVHVPSCILERCSMCTGRDEYVFWRLCPTQVSVLHILLHGFVIE